MSPTLRFSPQSRLNPHSICNKSPSNHPKTVISTGVRGPRRTFFVRWGATLAFCAVVESPLDTERFTNVCVTLCLKRPAVLPAPAQWLTRTKDTYEPLPLGESLALAFLSVIPAERSRMGGNLLLFSHRATTPPWQEPEGQRFNPANNTRTKAPHLAAAGLVFHPSPTPKLSSRPKARFCAVVERRWIQG